MKFIHSADWQIGARFKQFGENAARLGDARLHTLRRSLAEAAQRRVDAFLIAGDLFEDNQISPSLVQKVFEALAEADAFPIIILPGNHDPLSGPASVWARKPFSTPPKHLRIATAPEAMAIADGWILVNPLTQKRSTIDPSKLLAELAQSLPSDAIKIGVTHGSPAIEGYYQADDFPIALDAAARAGLDYLALGHWHRFLALDNGRMIMPGTPEPADFSETGAGCIHEVEITASGKPPKVTAIPVGQWNWRHRSFDLSDENRARSEAISLLDEISLPEISAVLRISLAGSASVGKVTEFRSWFGGQADARHILDFRDETSSCLTAEELNVLLSSHPIIAQVLDDLAALPGLAGDGHHSSNTLPSEAFTPEILAAARSMLMRELREISC